MVTTRDFHCGAIAAAVALMLLGCAGCASPTTANSSVGGTPSISSAASSVPGFGGSVSAPNSTVGSPPSVTTKSAARATDVPLPAPTLPTLRNIAGDQGSPELVRVGETVELIGDPWRLTAPPTDFRIGSLTNAAIYAKMLSLIPNTAVWAADASSVSMIVGAFHRQTDPDGHSIYAYLRLAGASTCTPSVGGFDTQGRPLPPPADGVPCNVGILYPLRGTGDPITLHGVA